MEGALRSDAATDFDEASILREARERAALEEFGDPSFLEPLRVLLRSLDAEAGLHAAGRAAQRTRIVDSLVNRLRAEEAFRRHPEILEERIGAPAVVAGLARTGTTMLHRLLASDPRVYAALWWECRNPAPIPGARSDAPDPRVVDAREQVRTIVETVPELAAIHPWDAEGPDEEIILLEHSFLSHVPESSAHLPSYRAWLDARDLAPGYAYLKKLLQLLQWQKRRRGERRERWVLKAPFHLGYLEALFETFPDARVIQTHRDPLETIPSVASMYRALWRLGADAVDPLEIGRLCRTRFAWALERCLRARERLPAERFCDVWYRDLARDALAQVRRIYAFLGPELSPEAEDAMRRWLVDHARERRPRHDYALADFGYTGEEIRRDFAAYRERFIVGREGAST